MAPSIGFDLDQCLVEAYNLVPFILFFETNLRVSDYDRVIIKKSRDIFYDLIASNEKTKHLFRPSLLKILPELLKMRKEGKINHMFIYSNNGYIQILNAIDHILALVLTKPPYSVNQADLIMEDGRLHVLTPRIYIDSACRVNTEEKVINFREKSLAGIQSCLNEAIPASDLWFIDDSLQHRDLITKLGLGDHYINVEAYKIHVSNTTLVDFFIKSLPKRVFIPNMPLYKTMIPLINKIFILESPIFYPTGKESHSTLVEKFHDIMSRNKYFKPESTSREWSSKKLETDYNIVKKLLSVNSSSQMPMVKYNFPEPTPYDYKTPIGGRPNSRRRRFRILRTRRKSQK